MRTIIGSKVANKWGSLHPTNPHLHMKTFRKRHINKGFLVLLNPANLYLPYLNDRHEEAGSIVMDLIRSCYSR